MAQIDVDQWEQFVSAGSSLLAAVRKSASVKVNSKVIRDDVKAFVQNFFREIRPGLLVLGLPVEDLRELDQALQDLNSLAQSVNRRSSYLKILTPTKARLTQLSVARHQLIGAKVSASSLSGVTETQVKICKTLEALVPAAALSFKQAVQDLGDSSRVSFRGSAAEMREVLREVVDHFAPDTDVIGAPGFHLEKNRDKPTMRQKVQFIFKQRGVGDTQLTASKDAADYIEAAPDKLARSLYNRSSLSAHVATSRKEVINLLRYTEALLAELLQV